MFNIFNFNIKKSDNKISYEDYFYTTLVEQEIIDIRNKFKVIDVEYFDKTTIDFTVFSDDYFSSNPHKKKVLNDMVEYFDNHKDNTILKKKTNYLCNEKEKICICNTHANDFRKIYDGVNYTDKTYISWIKKTNERF